MEHEKHKSICEPKLPASLTLFALAQRYISFGSMNMCVTNMKAEDFKISQHSLGHFRCVSASQGLLGTAGSRCEVPVY